MSRKLDPKHFFLLKLYFLVIAVVGIIGSLVSLGSVLNLTLKRLLISDEEIVNSSRYNYEMDECMRNPSLDPNIINTTNKTDEEIETCKAKKKVEIVNSRRIDDKTALIESLSRGILFLILMLTHLPAFLNTKKSPKGPKDPK